MGFWRFIAYFIDLKEKKLCRMIFKFCCIIIDKMRVK